MKDQYGRTIEYMRISITDRCNLRCRYCMPDGVNLIPMKELLSYEEICLVCRQAVNLGITKFKITGGEPLVRRDCSKLIASMKAIPGVSQVTLTSNGILLKEQMKDLKEAGLDAINISLDSLKADMYQQITKYDKLQEVLEGIHLCIEAGLRVKINCVLQKDVNESEWKDLVELAKTMPVDVRFIELMPIGEGNRQETVSNQWLLDSLQSNYEGLHSDSAIHGNGPAVYYKIPGFLGSIGLISAMHGKFCDRCNRIRMTSTGEIKPCLCFEKSISVKDAVRSGDFVKVRQLLEEAIWQKPKMHCFEDPEEITEAKKMVQIGG